MEDTEGDTYIFFCWGRGEVEEGRERRKEQRQRDGGGRGVSLIESNRK